MIIIIKPSTGTATQIVFAPGQEGKGTGAPEYWVAVIKPGTIIFEVEGVSQEVAKEAMRLAAQKLPVVTRFVVKPNYAE